jgi:hypothetical protein
MTSVNQIPGELNITTTQSDDLSVLLDFDIALTGYTFTAKVRVQSTEYALTITNTDLAAGQITLSALKSLLATIPVGEHLWYMDWISAGGLHRRALYGTFTLQNYP